MKAIRASALVLLMALTCSVYAGDIQNGTPAPPEQSVQETTTEGDIHYPIVEIVLNLLALF